MITKSQMNRSIEDAPTGRIPVIQTFPIPVDRSKMGFFSKIMDIIIMDGIERVNKAVPAPNVYQGDFGHWNTK